MTTSVALSPVAILQFFDNTGKPCVGGSLLTQSGGVNYATYSEPTGTTALPNPIPLNSRGEVSTAAGASSELFLQTGVAYTFTLKDAAGNQLWSIGNITSGGSGNVAVSFPTASGTGNAQIVTNAVPISLGLGTVQWFLPVSANTAATTINVDNSGAKNAFFLTKALVGGELQIGVPAQIIYDGTQWNLVQSAKGPAADYYVDTGTVNAIVVAINTAASSVVSNLKGTFIKVNVSNTNTSTTPTITINGTSYGIVLDVAAGTGVVAGQMIGGLTNIYLFYIPNNSSNAVLLNPSRATFSYTGTMTGVTTTVTGTITGATAQDGITKTLSIPQGFSGTSNAATCTITGGPTVMQPTTAQAWPVPVTDNSTASSGNMFIAAASGVISFGNTLTLGSAGSFTSSGTKTVPRLNTNTNFTVTYVSTP